MLQNYCELSQNELYALCQIRTTPCQFWTNCTPFASIYCTPCCFFGKGVQFRLAALSFFVFILAFDQDRINRKSPSYSLNMKGLSYFWNLLS
jgi:hypothetical protein